MRTLTQVDITGSRVLLRVDYNVSVDKDGNPLDDFKIKQSLTTIKYILKKAKQLIIMTHLGRPDGKKVKKLTTDKVALRLMKYLGRNIAKIDNCVDIIIPDDKIVFLENLRFHKEEKENDDLFAKKLSAYADVYVNDAFADSHRNHASITGVTKYLPSCAGFLLQKEIENLDLSKAKRPLIVIMGGSKLSTKFFLINKLLPKVDKLLLGGALIFTFYKAKGYEIGESICEDDQLTAATLLLNNEKIELPKDVVVASEVDEKAKSKVVDVNQIPKKWIGVDIGEKTIEDFEKILKDAKTIFWNGPMGVYEIEKFAKGSLELAEILSKLKSKVIVGGGDSAAIVSELGLRDKFFHVSTGGGASLEYIQKGTLPGIEVLKN